MINHRFKILGTFCAGIYWISDSLIHKVIYGEGEFEFLPSDLNELWMRIIIISLIFLLGSYADYYTKKVLQLAEEKKIIFYETVNATKYIMQNFIIEMLPFKIEVMKNVQRDDGVLNRYNQLIRQTSEQIKKLESITEVTKDNIRDSIAPK